MPFNEEDISGFTTIFGRNLLAEVPGFVLPPILVVTMEDLWPLFEDRLPDDVHVHLVRSMERSALESELVNLGGIASILGLGGGQAIDAAKYFAWRSNKPLIQFPTSLSVDAVFGHRAGVRENSLVRYIGFAVPQSVYIDLDIIEAAPSALNIGGVGDVFCFITGVMDWRYADRRESAKRAGPMTKASPRSRSPRRRQRWPPSTTSAISRPRAFGSWSMRSNGVALLTMVRAGIRAISRASSTTSSTHLKL